MSKHTPGPWHVGVGGNLHANRVWTADMFPITNLCSLGPSPADIDPEAQANGRLIAAAPDLLDALKELHNAVSKRAYAPACQDMGPLVLAARAAIAKAEEQQ